MANIISASVQLHYQEGSSDKVYNVTLEQTNIGLYVVNFAYGRRNSTLNTGTKTIKPIDLITATKIFDKLVQEKMAKGYLSNYSTPGVIIPTSTKSSTGILPMLLQSIDEDEVEQYLEDDRYVMQEKLDGERRLIKIAFSLAIGINRKGQEVALPKPLEAEAAKFSNKSSIIILDGEQIGEDFYAFDLIKGDVNAYTHSFEARYKELEYLLAKYKRSYIRLVKTAEGFSAKAKLYEKLQAESAEGVVFRNKVGLYSPGRSTQALKYKFYETASFIVTVVNAQRSVQIAVNADGALLPVGNVTILPNFPVPEPGAVVEVRYLYAYQGGSIYQPVYLGERSDLTHDDCSISQLKYKSNISLI